MHVKGKRVRFLAKAVPGTPTNKVITVLLPLSTVESGVLKRVGFSEKPSHGDTVVPAPEFGPVSRFNAGGRDVVHKDRPKETAYRQVMWNHKEWRGPDTVDVSSIVDMPYKRYPRTFVPPPGIELRIRTTSKGVQVIAADAVKDTAANAKQLLHTVNLFLEIFRECRTVDADEEDVIEVPLRRLNWTLLPPGEMAFEDLEPRLKEILKNQAPQVQLVVWARIREVYRYGPQFVAVGNGGFRGYVVFGFPQKGLFVLESSEVGNAIYIFAEDWEHLSQLTKAEILEGHLQKGRIVHRQGWEKALGRVLA